MGKMKLFLPLLVGSLIVGCSKDKDSNSFKFDPPNLETQGKIEVVKDLTEAEFKAAYQSYLNNCISQVNNPAGLIATVGDKQVSRSDYHRPSGKGVFGSHGVIGVNEVTGNVSGSNGNELSVIESISSGTMSVKRQLIYRSNGNEIEFDTVKMISLQPASLATMKSYDETCAEGPAEESKYTQIIYTTQAGQKFKAFMSEKVTAEMDYYCNEVEEIDNGDGTYGEKIISQDDMGLAKIKYVKIFSSEALSPLQSYTCYTDSSDPAFNFAEPNLLSKKEVRSTDDNRILDFDKEEVLDLVKQ